MIDDIFKISDHIRYVAIYRDGQLKKDSKPGTVGTSSSQSDTYEELLVIISDTAEVSDSKGQYRLWWNGSHPDSVRKLLSIGLA